MMLSIHKQLSRISNDSDIVSLFSLNRYEWFLCEQAIYMANQITCPLYSTLGLQAMKHILKQTETRVIYCSNANLKQLLNVMKQAKTSVTNIICFDDFELSEDDKLFIKIQKVQIEKIDLSGIETNDYKNISTLKADDLATICYTSGTSGLPKGAMLTHKNFLSTLEYVYKNDNDFLIVDRNSTYVSYLPLAHVMERLCTHSVVVSGGRIGIFRGNAKLLREDIQIIKPTFIVGVPRVFNLFREKILDEIEKKSWFVKMLFNFALKWKISNQKYGIYEHWFFDWLIFDKIKNLFGGKISEGLSGSAPLNPDVTSFLQAVFSFRMTEGYGSTEATAANILKTLDCHEPGNVGAPFPVNVVKLVPLPGETEPRRGEIYLKGDNVFKGYFKDPEKTQKTLIDGWLKTGDIARVVDNKFEIVGRDKDIFKTSLGEYIAPDKIEGVFKSTGVCEDIFITGTMFCDYIVAIVVDTTSKLDSSKVLEKLKKVGNEKVETGELCRFEIPKKVLVVNQDFFSLDLLTTTFKKKRHEIFSKFENEILALYSQ